jgi:hypothetical protein
MYRTSLRLPLRRAIDRYVAVVVVLGVVVAMRAVIATPPVAIGPVVLMAVLCGAAQLLRVALPRASSVSPTVAISFMALVWLGLSGAVVVALAGMLAHALALRQAPLKAVFNAAAWVLAAATAAIVYWLLGGPSSNQYLADMATTVIAATAYFAVNTGLVAGAISLSGRTSFWSVWSDNYLGVAPGYALMAIIGAASAVAVETGGPLALVASAGLVLLPWTSVALQASKARRAARALAVLAERGDYRPRHGPGAVA